VAGRKEIKVFKLEGLGCANCAAKMEIQIGKLNGVINARIDFVSTKMIIEVSGKERFAEIMKQIPQIVDSIEHGVKITDVQPSAGYKDWTILLDKKQIVLLIMGIGILIAALILELTIGIQFFLFLLSYILIGQKVIFKAIRNTIRGEVFDENFLMFIATAGALATRQFPEAIAVMLFYQTGEFLQNIAVNRSRRSISSLMDIRPDFANLIEGNEERTVAPEKIEIGQAILVKPGEKIPLDGTVIEGFSVLDTSALTGEFIPRQVKAGDNVLAGFINKNGLLNIKVTKSYNQSTVARILEMVENASSKKAPTENFITKFAHYYTPAVVLGAALIAFIPPLLMQDAVFFDWLNRGLIFLVVSCPCALVISIPLSFFGGIGGASRNGVLIKGSNYLEALNNVRTVVFDKTGTLTEGVFEVTKISPIEGISEEMLIKYAAFAERYSNHPIAASILQKYSRQFNDNEISEYEEIPGYGVKAVYNEKKIIAGSARFMIKETIHMEKDDNRGTVVYVAVNGDYIGSISISDRIREDTSKAIEGLRQIGVQRIVMLTGDKQDVSEMIGRELGFDEVYAGLLPDQKVEILENIEKQKDPQTKIGFIGDGINDAPVLARADIGIAMGGLGSDAAIEAADIVLMTDEPSKIISAFQIARKTRDIVWQNIVLALGIKSVVLFLAALGLATMWAAVFADVGVTVIAVLNATRVLNFSPKPSKCSE